jgi:arylsulfatase A-like enzyme
MKFDRYNCLCRALLLPALLLEFSALAQSPASTNAAPRPIPRRTSIILVVADGLGYGDLSCYGQTNFQTPNLDRLAAEGVRFTNYSAGAAADSPARAALMLGKDPGHLRQRADADIPLAPDEITVAQMLKNSGYATGLIGEWSLGNENSGGAPWRKGFDEFAGYLDANDAANFYADYMWRLNPGFTYDPSYNDPINGHWRAWNQAGGLPNPGREMIYANTQGKNQYIPDLLTKAAVGFIKINQPDPANHYRPFFLVINYKIPGDARSQVPTDAPFSEERWPQPAKNRAAMIARFDGYIAQLQQQLQQLRMTNNAAIFFTSATVPPRNGAVSPNFFHSVTSSNDLRVPMIVRWPGRIPPGVVSGYKWSAEDFLPTAAEIGFATPPAGITGKPVPPALGETVKK